MNYYRGMGAPSFLNLCNEPLAGSGASEHEGMLVYSRGKLERKHKRQEEFTTELALLYESSQIH